MLEQDGIQLELFPESEMQTMIEIQDQTGLQLTENLQIPNPQLELEFPN